MFRFRLFACLSAGAILLACLSPLQADHSYVQDGSIGKAPDPPKLPGLLLETLPPDKWVGQKIIILPEQVALQHFGYVGMVRGRRGNYSTPYKDIAGKIATITSCRVENGLETMRFTVDGTKDSYVTKFYGHLTDPIKFDNIAFVSDLDFARAQWEGKSLWPTVSKLQTYDQSKDLPNVNGALWNSLSDFEIEKLKPLTVDKVTASWYPDRPIRLILKTADGKEGFADVRVSYNNTGSTSDTRYDFDTQFLATDPMANCTDEMREAIKASKVIVGMTPEQVKICWGKPSIIMAGKNEEWLYWAGLVHIGFDVHYASRSATFADGKVISVTDG